MIFRNPELQEVEYVILHMRESSRDEVVGLWEGSLREYARFLHEYSDMLWIGYADKAPTAVMGARRVHGCVWGAFGFGTDEWRMMWREVLRFSMTEFADALRAEGATRVQTVVRADREDRIRWAKFLGATEESVLRKFGVNGEDYRMFAWIGE